MGAFDYLSSFCSVSRRGKRKPMQTVEMKVKMDCDGCERRVREAARKMRGVKRVEVNRKESKVTVTGHVDPSHVLKRVMRRTGKRAEPWPYIPHHLVHYPFAAGAPAYDKRAPPGHVKNLRHAFPPEEERGFSFTSFFSDDNVNACSLM